MLRIWWMVNDKRLVGDCGDDMNDVVVACDDEIATNDSQYEELKKKQLRKFENHLVADDDANGDAKFVAQVVM